MSEHSFIAPSSAHQWANCAGSPHLSKEFPSEDSEDSREGDAVHGMIAHCMVGNTLQAVGEVEPVHGLVITTEMHDSAMVFIREVSITAGERDITIDDYHVEERIECPDIHETSFGSVDLWFHDVANHDLYLYDYKNGHDKVEVFENDQMLNYASGVVRKLALQGVDTDELNVWLVIIQPRGHHKDGPCRYWLAEPHHLKEGWDKLIKGALAVYAPNPMCTPGKWCKNCDGRRVCEAASNEAMFGADMATQSTPEELTPDQAGIQLAILERAANAMQYRITGLQAQVKATIGSGKSVLNYDVVATTGNLAWSQPLETCLAIEAMTGIDIKAPLKLITPTQAKNAGVSPAVLKHFANRPSRGMKLVATDLSTARRIFS